MARRTPPARGRGPSIRRSTSSRVVCTANDARELAGTPRRRISGCAQWWPARTQTPSRPRISATSCGWTSSKANEREAAAVLELGRAVQRQSGDRPQPLDRVARDVARVLPDGVHAEAGQVVDGGAEPDRLGDRHRARLEARGRLGALGLVVADARDHVPAAEERRHRLEQLAAPVQDADAGRPVGLVAGPGVEVRAQRRHVDGQVRDGLRAVDEHERAGGVRALGDLRDRVDRAEHVGDVGDRDELGAARQQVVERVEVEQAVVRDRRRRRARRPSRSTAAATARGWSGAPSA